MGQKPNVQFVKALISYGTEYIDTGVAVDDTTIVHASLYIEVWNKDYENLFGAPLNQFGAIRTMGFNEIGILYKGQSEFVYIFPCTPPVAMDIVINASTNTATVNGTTRAISGTIVFSDKPLWIFTKANSSGGVDVPGAFKLYSFTITKGGALVRDFVPALDGAGTPCLYDMVSSTFFYNAGTGEFGYETLGGEVVNG